ncbi:hypothetical protein Mal4_04790 [Maioricimonas rarisocia]|uniref:PilZ domain-containing protein n=1 Tax=Maioricimonas rarisocia TaxID=2528026 RepID=A0A517Z144_9PLAN|nr:hypothetical protein [Maioricimonas rarisocia]QDU36195.1 hypothetical protein Mal4_04790 [Maioricimonas rarisocia]
MSKQESARKPGDANDGTAQESQRSEFRIVFPDTDRPELRIGDNTYAVRDLSESAMSVLAPRFYCEQIEELSGTLVMRDGSEHAVTGRFIRCSDDRSVVKFEGAGMPYRTILKLQQELIRKYPKWGREHGHS